jgi:hypothetical protein
MIKRILLASMLFSASVTQSAQAASAQPSAACETELVLNTTFEKIIAQSIPADEFTSKIMIECYSKPIVAKLETSTAGYKLNLYIRDMTDILLWSVDITDDLNAKILQLKGIKIDAIDAFNLYRFDQRLLYEVLARCSEIYRNIRTHQDMPLTYVFYELMMVHLRLVAKKNERTFEKLGLQAYSHIEKHMLHACISFACCRYQDYSL